MSIPEHKQEAFDKSKGLRDFQLSSHKDYMERLYKIKVSLESYRAYIAGLNLKDGDLIPNNPEVTDMDERMDGTGEDSLHIWHNSSTYGIIAPLDTLLTYREREIAIAKELFINLEQLPWCDQRAHERYMGDYGDMVRPPQLERYDFNTSGEEPQFASPNAYTPLLEAKECGGICNDQNYFMFESEFNSHIFEYQRRTLVFLTWWYYHVKMVYQERESEK